MRILAAILILFSCTVLFSQEDEEDFVRHCTDSCTMSAGPISILNGEFEASSCLADKKDPGKYCPEKAFDNDLSTSWVEGKEGQGLNEKLAFHIKKNINSISILPGFGNAKYFKMNNRVKKAVLSIYKINMASPSELDIIGYNIEKLIKTITLDFKDEMKMQSFDIGIGEVGKFIEPWKGGNTVECGYVGVIEIIEVYPGIKWNDTCIAEIVIK